MKLHLLCALLVPAVCAAPLQAKENQLTAAEKSAGWQLLFDGTTTKNWRGYTQSELPMDKWEIVDGTLHTKPTPHGQPAGDSKKRSELITEKKYNDFDLTWDWKLEKGANNGLKYFVTEARPAAPGHEYQMVDDGVAEDGMDALHQTASFYDVLPPAKNNAVKPAGEWNTSRIVVRGNHVEHYLNGKLAVAYDLGSPEVKAGIAKSKFKNSPGFGDKIAGHIMLTYHNDECWYRNIKIRELKN